MRAVIGALEQAGEADPQATVAAEDLDQIPVQEAVVPDALEHQVQLQPDVLQPRQAVHRRGEGDIHPLLVAGEQLFDDVVLVAEVVVQVAGTDLQLVGDMVGGDVRLALRIEHRERGVEDALAGVARHGLRRAASSPDPRTSSAHPPTRCP